MKTVFYVAHSAGSESFADRVIAGPFDSCVDADLAQAQLSASGVECEVEQSETFAD